MHRTRSSSGTLTFSGSLIPLHAVPMRSWPTRTAAPPHPRSERNSLPPADSSPTARSPPHPRHSHYSRLRGRGVCAAGQVQRGERGAPALLDAHGGAARIRPPCRPRNRPPRPPQAAVPLPTRIPLLPQMPLLPTAASAVLTRLLPFLALTSTLSPLAVCVSVSVSVYTNSIFLLVSPYPSPPPPLHARIPRSPARPTEWVSRHPARPTRGCSRHPARPTRGCSRHPARPTRGCSHYPARPIRGGP